jgi:hypothetical protein
LEWGSDHAGAKNAGKARRAKAAVEVSNLRMEAS